MFLLMISDDIRYLNETNYTCAICAASNGKQVLLFLFLQRVINHESLKKIKMFSPDIQIMVNVSLFWIDFVPSANYSDKTWVPALTILYSQLFLSFHFLY